MKRISNILVSGSAHVLHPTPEHTNVTRDYFLDSVVAKFPMKSSFIRVIGYLYSKARQLVAYCLACFVMQ